MFCVFVFWASTAGLCFVFSCFGRPTSKHSIGPKLSGFKTPTIVSVLKPPSRSCCDDAEPYSQQCSTCSWRSPLKIIVLIVLLVLSELSELSMLGVLSMLGLLSLLVLIVFIVLDQLVARGRRR